MKLSPLLDELIDALRCMPGVGPKSAQRIAMHLLTKDRIGGDRLVSALSAVLASVNHCQSCQNFTENRICELCKDEKRDHKIFCVVENPMDVISFEQAGNYRGLYFVLFGNLSPLDGVGPKELGLDMLVKRLETEEIDELILATSTTVEGEATAQYIGLLATECGINVSRIAHGVPMGGDLEYVDTNTLAYAISGRRHYAI